MPRRGRCDDNGGGLRGQVAAPATPAISSVFKADPPRFVDPARRQKLGQAFPAIDRLMQDFATREHIPGATWGIVIDGELAHLGVAGSRDLANGSPSARTPCSASRR